jgi:hypothetical protein
VQPDVRALAENVGQRLVEQGAKATFLTGSHARGPREWTWDKIEREADAWVADKLVLWSEYLPKLAGGARGAAELFRLLAEDVDALLDERQRAAVEYALATS